MRRHHNREATAARAEIQNHGRWPSAGKSPRLFGQQFCFRTRHQHVAVHLHFQAAKNRRAQKMLQWNARGAAGDQQIPFGLLRLGERFLGPQRQLRPRAVQHVGEQPLGIHARRVHARSGQCGGGGLQCLGSGHGVCLKIH